MHERCAQRCVDTIWIGVPDQDSSDGVESQQVTCGEDQVEGVERD